MANGIISKLIKSGDWTPKIYDNETYKADWTSTGYYWKIGKLVIATFPGEKLALSNDISISTLLTFGNLPMRLLIGSTTLYMDWINTYGADKTIQGNVNANIVDLYHACAHIRPNYTGTLPKNAKIQAVFIGFDY